MKKLYIQILCSICITVVSLFPLFAFSPRPSFEDDAVHDQAAVTFYGHIVIFGSEPHTFPGVVTDDGKKYAVTAAEDVLKQLYEFQGTTLRLTGIIIPPAAGGREFHTLEDGSFILKSWSEIP
jgi:hypothetical protein